MEPVGLANTRISTDCAQKSPPSLLASPGSLIVPVLMHRLNNNGEAIQSSHWPPRQSNRLKAPRHSREGSTTKIRDSRNASIK